MIDFGCKTFILDDIIKCGLGLTRAEFKVMKYFLDSDYEGCTTSSIANKLKLNVTTIQKAVKTLYNKKILIRRQHNLDTGGYTYTYESNSRSKIRSMIKEIIRNWYEKVEKKIDFW